MKAFLIAAEESGDRLGAALMRALCQEAAQHLSAHDVVTADRKFSP